jgi:membrane protease YdiL (CAAX protease family)
MRVAAGLVDPATLPVGPPWLWLPVSLVDLAWSMLYPLWVARRRHAVLPRLPRPRAIAVESLLALVVVPVVLVVNMLVFQLLVHFLGDRALPTLPWESVARSPDRVASVGLRILAVVAMPLAEEVFFRGMVYSALRQRLSVIVAMPLQAVVFALAHPFGAADTAAVALLSVAFAVVYEWRKTLLAPVLLHTLVNAVAMAVMAWAIASTPRLGVSGETHARGCLLTTVTPGSAADQAGMQTGDIVISLDGNPVADFRSLTQAVRRRQIGQTVVVEYLRGKDVYRVDAILTKLQE